MTFDGVDGLTVITVLNATLSFLSSRRFVASCHPERSEGSPRRLHIQHLINRHPEEGIINE